MGPMTGRAAGYCAGSAAPGFATLGMGRCRGVRPGWGRGRGFGRRCWGPPARYYGPQAACGVVGPWGARRISREEELDYLKDQAGELKHELDAISSRVKELEAEEGGSEGARK